MAFTGKMDKKKIVDALTQVREATSYLENIDEDEYPEDINEAVNIAYAGLEDLTSYLNTFDIDEYNENLDEEDEESEEEEEVEEEK